MGFRDCLGDDSPSSPSASYSSSLLPCHQSIGRKVCSLGFQAVLLAFEGRGGSENRVEASGRRMHQLCFIVAWLRHVAMKII